MSETLGSQGLADLWDSSSDHDLQFLFFGTLKLLSLLQPQLFVLFYIVYSSSFSCYCLCCFLEPSSCMSLLSWLPLLGSSYPFILLFPPFLLLQYWCYSHCFCCLYCSCFYYSSVAASFHCCSSCCPSHSAVTAIVAVTSMVLAESSQLRTIKSRQEKTTQGQWVLDDA